jgi:hypothetical protein
MHVSVEGISSFMYHSTGKSCRVSIVDVHPAIDSVTWEV